MKEKRRVLFYAHVKNKSLFDDVSFYEQDIRALKEMGFDVIISNQLRDFFFKDYDFVFIWWWSRAIIPVLLSRVKGFKVCIAGAFHYSTPLMPGTDYVRRSWLYRKLIGICLRYADGNIFVSEYEYKDVCDNLIVNNPCLVHHGIDTCKYKPANDFIEINKQEDRQFSILSISWLEKNNLKRKCIYESLVAFELLHQAGVDAIYYIAGREGPGSNELKDFIHTLSSKSRIKLLGHVTEEHKIALLQSVDVFLSPTLYEGFGVAIAEALACGCPVVTSSNGAVGEVAGPSALYADPSDPKDISEKVLRLLKDKEFISTIRRDAVERVRSRFSYPAHFRSLSDAVEYIYNT